MKYQKETQGISRDRTAVAVAMLFVSEIDPDPANIAAAIRGDGFDIRPRRGCDRNGNKNSEEWRDKDVWHVYAADMLRAIRKIKEHQFSKDAIWLDAMASLWRMAFRGTSEPKYFQWAKSLARHVGELKYWKRQIKPVMLLTARLSQGDHQFLNIPQAILAGALRIEGPGPIAMEALPSPNWSLNWTEFLPHG